MQKYNGQLIRQFASSVSGNAASGVTVTVRRKSDNALATLYVDNNTAGATLSNPITTSATGHFAFYAADGVYTLTFSDNTPQQVIQLQDVAALQDQFDSAVLNAGYIPSGTFAAGATLTQANQVLSDGSSYWRWDGSLPKTVTAGSAPVPTGVGGWVLTGGSSHGDLDDFKASLGMVGSSEFVAGTEAKYLINTLSPEQYGAVSGQDATNAVRACYAACATLKKLFLMKSDYLVSDTISIPVGVETIANNHYFKCIDGSFASGNKPVVQIGNWNTGTRWIGRVGVLQVDCNGTKAVGIDFNYTWLGCDCSYAKVIRHDNIGILHSHGYGLQLLSWSSWAISKMEGFSRNAAIGTKGFQSNTSDSYYGPSQVFGSWIGIHAYGGMNVYVNPHCWSIYKKADGTELACPMGICIWNQGQSNTFIKPIADSPSMLDYNSPATEANGGFGFWNNLYGYQSTFVGANVFIPNRSFNNEVVPVGKIQAYKCDQSATYIGCEKFDDSIGNAAFAPETFEGGNRDTCFIMGRGGVSMYTNEVMRMRRRMVASKGLDINTIYDDADTTIDNWGIINFKQTDNNWLRINANYQGTIKEIKIERAQKGNTGNMAFIATQLTADDEGYTFWLTDVKKPVYWDGAKFIYSTGAPA